MLSEGLRWQMPYSTLGRTSTTVTFDQNSTHIKVNGHVDTRLGHSIYLRVTGIVKSTHSTIRITESMYAYSKVPHSFKDRCTYVMAFTTCDTCFLLSVFCCCCYLFNVTFSMSLIQRGTFCCKYRHPYPIAVVAASKAPATAFLYMSYQLLYLELCRPIR